MPKRLNSNADLVDDLMNYSPRGALGQVFVMQAIQDYARRCIAAGPAAFDSPMLSGDAWVAVAADVRDRCDAFYNRHAKV